MSASSKSAVNGTWERAGSMSSTPVTTFLSKTICPMPNKAGLAAGLHSMNVRELRPVYHILSTYRHHKPHTMQRWGFTACHHSRLAACSRHSRALNEQVQTVGTFPMHMKDMRQAQPSSAAKAHACHFHGGDKQKAQTALHHHLPSPHVHAHVHDMSKARLHSCSQTHATVR